MAYTRDLNPPQCQEDGCHAQATKALFGSYNETLGSYCGRHASVRLKARAQFEAFYDDAITPVVLAARTF